MEEKENSSEVSYQAGNKLALKHREEYDIQIFEHMLNGYSFSSFQVKPQVDRKTMTNWLNNVESFRLGYERGVAEFLKRCETAFITEMFGLPLTESQKKWMPKVNHKLLRFMMSKRFRKEYGVQPKIETDEETNQVLSITFIECEGRAPTKRDPVTGAPIKPDIDAESIELNQSDE